MCYLSYYSTLMFYMSPRARSLTFSVIIHILPTSVHNVVEINLLLILSYIQVVHRKVLYKTICM